MNKVLLVGRLTADPELRYTPNGSAVCDVTVAVDRVSRDGERAADFIFCQVWNKQAENLAKFTRKGYRVGVEGWLNVDSYEKDGQRKWVTRVVCQRVEFLESKHDDRPAVVKDARGVDFGTEVQFKDEDLPF